MACSGNWLVTAFSSSSPPERSLYLLNESGALQPSLRGLLLEGLQLVTFSGRHTVGPPAATAMAVSIQ